MELTVAGKEAKMTYDISEMLAAAEADAAEARVRAEASAREAKEARAAAREAKEAAARSAVEAAEIEMAVLLSDYIAGSLKKRWRIVRDTGLLATVLRHFPNPVMERYGDLMETEWRDGPYADLDDRPAVTDRA